MPARIPDTPENIARAIMRGPPKKEWDYLKAAKAGKIQEWLNSAPLGKHVYNSPS